MTALACADCGLRYSDPGWCDVVIPDDDWAAISPTGGHGGVLCLTCIARRLVASGRRDVPMMVTSGPFERDGRDGVCPSWTAQPVRQARVP